MGTWHDLDLGRPLAAPLEQCAQLLGVDLATIHKLAAKIEPYLRPDELWHADMTKVWTAQHGWVYLHAIVDCCTRELVGWSLELRCRDDEAIACVEAAVQGRNVPPGTLTSAQITAASSPPATSAATCQPAGSPTAAAATAIPSPSIHRVLVRPVHETPGVVV